jgi:divalent metal cation (Fe/Co/Zn/Cd) transporter
MKGKFKEELKAATIAISFLAMFFIGTVLFVFIEDALSLFDSWNNKEWVLTNFIICVVIVLYIFFLFKFSAYLSYKLVDRVFRT